MKKIIQATCLFIVLIANSATAQLANWTVGSNAAFTNFPANNVGQINGFCRITQMKWHPVDANKMYALTAEGGLFITTDAGSNWTVAGGTENITGSCASLCIDYSNDQVIYLGSGDADYYSNGQGIYKSTNGGATFTATSLTNCLVVEIFQSPTDPATFVAATNKGIYKSTDNGATWIAKTSTTIPFCDMVPGAGTNSPILYACTKDNVSAFYRSTDFGSTWTQITSGLATPATFLSAGGRIAVTPANPNVVYFEMISGSGVIHKSNDGGLTFTVKRGEGTGTLANPYLTFYDYNNANGLGGQGNYNNCLWADVNDPSKVWLQSHDTYFSSDSGVTWTELTHWSSKLHTDMHQICQSPYDASKLYCCNDGGVWLSTDGGNNWTPKSNGLYAYEVASNAGKSSHTNRDYVTIGTQDNARLYRNANGWFTISGGDDYEMREYDYLPNGGYYYLKDGNTRSAAPGGTPATYGLPTPNWEAIVFNRTNPNVAFMGSSNIYRTVNLSSSTATWTQISSFSTPIKAIHSCIADINRLYVMTNDQKLYVSSNAMSATPTFVSYTLPTVTSGSYPSITALPNNANTVYFTANAKVYVSIDGGQTWTNITYNLPNVFHRKILAEEYGGTQGLVFIATNNAVYYIKNGQTTWTNYSTNLPGRRAPTDFSMYDDSTNKSLIRFSSYGRAVWETPFGNLRGMSGSFDVNQKLYCTTGSPVTFTDYSTGNITSWSWVFPGGTPATSTAQNPVVTYNSPGLYGATLTVSDGANTSTISKGSIFWVMASAPTVNTGCTIPANSNLGNGFGIGISSFSLGNISNLTSHNDGAYKDYTCLQSTSLTQGSAYSATITTGTVNAEGAKLFIDLNNNGVFEASEALVTYPSNNTGTRALSFTVPSSGVILNTGLRLRVVSRFNSIPSSACDVSTYGQAEDYTVFIVPVPSAVMSNGSGLSTICSGQSANLKVNIVSGTSPYTITISDGTNTQTINNYSSGSDIPVSPLTNTSYSLVTVLDYFGTSIPVSGSGSVTLNAYVITASAGANGNITPTGSVSVTCGTNQPYTITPNAGYIVQDVLIDGVSQGAITTYTFTNVTAVHTISASFTIACQPNTWTGASNTLWSTPGNWDCGIVPEGGADIAIPDVANDPVLDANITTGNISLASGATLSIGSNILTINGAVSGTGTLTISPSSGLTTSATTTLRFTPGANSLKNLNVTAGTTTLGNALDITAGLSAGTAGTVTVTPGAVLASAGNLTFKSNQFGTARLAAGDIAGNYVTGEVTVERYIPDNGFRSWRLLSVPTFGNGQTIRQAWQEGLSNPLPLQNNVPNFGTQITGTGLLATAQAAGFDNVAASAALLSWSGTAWVNTASTNTGIATTKGYFMFIRGERSKGVTGANTNSSATTLRTRGLLYEGNQTSATLPANGFNLIGNLYPSAIDFTSLIRTGSVNNLFYIWDSKKLSGNSLGVYQTFSATNGFLCLVSGGSYIAGQPNTVIESGQAFFVTTGGTTGTITLTEASKINSSGSSGFRPANTLVKIDSRLFSMAGNSDEIVDANVVVFDEIYSNTVDADDAIKLANAGENFGISTGNKTVAIEGRQPLSASDVIHFNMSNLKKQEYKLEFVPNNLSAYGLVAILQDNYLKQTTEINLNVTNSVIFTVDDNPASSASDRFILLFKKPSTNALNEQGFTVSPNPTEGNSVNIQFANQPAGNYSVRLLGSNGQLITGRVIKHAGGSTTQVMYLPENIDSGTYQVEIISTDKTRTARTLIIQKN